jgi:hypothetical protein
MNISRHVVAKALARPLVIVELEVVVESGGQVRTVRVLVDGDVFVLDGAPERLNEAVVINPTSAVHADANTRCLQLAGEIASGKLNTLVRVEGGWLSVPERQAQGSQSKGTG